jgi:hypothetical protein
MLYTRTDLDRVRSIPRATWAADSDKFNWFKVTHDILPTNERLLAIRLAGSALCSICGEHDIMHWITVCGEERVIWEWTSKRIVWILHMDLFWIPNEWTIRPKFKLWQPNDIGQYSNACTHGVVQDTWETDSVSAGVLRFSAQGQLEGVPGHVTCKSSRDLSIL